MTTIDNTLPPAWRYEQAMLQRLAVEPEFLAHKDAWLEAMERKDMATAVSYYAPVARWIELTKQIQPAQAEIVAQASLAACQQAYELLQRHPSAWTADDFREQRSPRQGAFMYRLRVYIAPAVLVAATAVLHPSLLLIAVPAAVLFGRWQGRLMCDQIYTDLALEKARAGALPDDAQRLRHVLGLQNVRVVSYGLVVDLAKRYQAVLVERAAAEKAAQEARRQAAAKAQVIPARVGGAALGTGLAATAGAGVALAATYQEPTHYQPEDLPATQDLSPTFNYDYDDTSWIPELPDPYGDVNPVSGLPMIGGGSPIDVGGNVYGTNDFF